MRPACLIFSALLLVAPLSAEGRRARDLGVPFDFGSPGPGNAITDVPGVAVGHVTLVKGDRVRTGVTSVLPRILASAPPSQCFGASFSLNGNGEMTGLPWVDESGLVEGPILITNTNSVGVVRDAVIQYAARRYGAKELWSLPIVAETWDGFLNDIYGHHVKPEDAFAAIDGARPGPVSEGGVGGGTGMVCYEFKGGIGTASRIVRAEGAAYTVGILVQANFGRRHQLRVAGVPVGIELKDDVVYSKETGSIIILIATDAPLLPHQLKRLARRAGLGMARTGGVAGNGSGDLFLAFSTANPKAGEAGRVVPVDMLPVSSMDGLFEAVVGATEEAIVNALVAGRTMSGIDGHRVIGLPHERLQEILKRYGRLAAGAK